MIYQPKADPPSAGASWQLRKSYGLIEGVFMPEGKMCPICKKWFIPNKYRKNQCVCSNLECQYKRQLDNMKKWRENNPNYFKYREVKDNMWRESCRERAKKWRSRHLEYLKLYRQEHREMHREYMRNYMKEYRNRKKKDMQKKAETPKDSSIGIQPDNSSEPTDL